MVAGCDVAVYADAGGHAAIVLIGDIKLPQAHPIVTKTFTRWNWWTSAGVNIAQQMTK